MPEVASLPLHVTLSEWLYQPFASAPRLGVPATPLGGSPSTLITFVVIAVVPPALVAVQVRVVPVFAPMGGPGSQPFVDVIGDSGSLTVQWTTT
jgi:hypothetical protein